MAARKRRIFLADWVKPSKSAWGRVHQRMYVRFWYGTWKSDRGRTLHALENMETVKTPLWGAKSARPSQEVFSYAWRELGK